MHRFSYLRRYGGGLLLIALLLGAFFAVRAWRFVRGGGLSSPGVLPTPLLHPQEPEIATEFDFPLPPGEFGPYIPYETGPLPVDTRYGAQNPGLGSEGKCFVDLAGAQVPFDQLYHAGEDWFAYDASGQVVGGQGAGATVSAIAAGRVTWTQSLGREGNVLILEHLLLEGDRVWSVYWHVAEVQVSVGEAVTLGQPLGRVHDRGFNSHLHWEIRTFADGSMLFPSDSAGGRGTCNGYAMGVGYTWDDVLTRAYPEAWGYLSPSEFVMQRKTGGQ